MRKANVFILFVLILMALLPSCKGTRSLERGEQPASFRHWVKLMQQHESSFVSMNASRISVKAGMGEKELNVSASLRMRTDSAIVLSVIPFMGIEMYTLELYPDRWMLYDKVNRVYYTDTYEYFNLKWGVKVDFDTFQSLFSTRFFSNGTKGMNAQNWKYTPMESGKNKIERTEGAFRQSLTAYADHTVEQVVWSDRDEHFALMATYRDYAVNRGVNYPKNILLECLADGAALLRLDMKVEKVSFNTDFRLNPANPERYKRASLDQLLP